MDEILWLEEDDKIVMSILARPNRVLVAISFCQNLTWLMRDNEKEDFKRVLADRNIKNVVMGNAFILELEQTLADRANNAKTI